MSEEKTYPLFVYGTLRPGQPLWPYLKGSVVGNAHQAFAKGFRLAHSLAGDYPVMVPVLGSVYKPEQKIVRGTLVHVRNDTQFQSIWNMEVRAGYEPEVIRVFTGPTPDTLTFREEAFAFVWPSTRYDYSNLLVPEFRDSGAVVYDWAAEVLRNAVPGLDEVQTIPSQKLLTK